MIKRKMFQCTEENTLVRINIASTWVAGTVVASCGRLAMHTHPTVHVVQNRGDSSDQATSISVRAVIYLLFVMCKEPEPVMQIEPQGRRSIPLAFSSS